MEFKRTWDLWWIEIKDLKLQGNFIHHAGSQWLRIACWINLLHLLQIEDASAVRLQALYHLEAKK